MVIVMLVEDFCLQRTPGCAGVVRSFEGRMVEQVSSGWFDGAILLEFFSEIIERHGDQFPKKDRGDIRLSFWRMTENNPNRSDEVGDVLCVEVGETTYGVCPVRRKTA